MIEEFRCQIYESNQYKNLIINDDYLQLVNGQTQRKFELTFNLEVEFNFHQSISPQKLNLSSLILYSGTSIIFLKIETRKLIEVHELLGMKVIYKKFESNYQVLETISQTKNSKVYKVLMIPTGQVFIAKIIKTIDISTQNELTICRLINNKPHQNLMESRCIYFNRTHYLLLTPFYEGGTLFQYIIDNKCKVKLENVKAIMLQILDGINHMHKFGIMHRDIKLDNVMLQYKNDPYSIKIIDYGFATLEKFNLNKCGTPGYIAPEVFQISTYNESCDIYSVGAVFHALMTGYRIFDMNSELVLNNKRNLIKKSSLIKKYPLADQLFDSMVSAANLRPSALLCMEHEFFSEIEDENDHNIQNKLNTLIFPPTMRKVILD